MIHRPSLPDKRFMEEASLLDLAVWDVCFYLKFERHRPSDRDVMDRLVASARGENPPPIGPPVTRYACDNCPRWEVHRRGKVKRGCRLMAEEVVAIVLEAKELRDGGKLEDHKPAG